MVLLGALEWIMGVGQTAHPIGQATSTGWATRALVPNVAFYSHHRNFVLVGGCAAPSLSAAARPLLPISPPMQTAEMIEEERKENHISRSQRCIGDIGSCRWAISSKHLLGPARSKRLHSQSPPPTLHIDFRLTGVVDVPVWLPVLTYVTPLYVSAVM